MTKKEEAKDFIMGIVHQYENNHTITKGESNIKKNIIPITPFSDIVISVDVHKGSDDSFTCISVAIEAYINKKWLETLLTIGCVHTDEDFERLWNLFLQSVMDNSCYPVTFFENVYLKDKVETFRESIRN